MSKAHLTTLTLSSLQQRALATGRSELLEYQEVFSNLIKEM
jgi:hypothetical protein